MLGVKRIKPNPMRAKTCSRLDSAAMNGGVQALSAVIRLSVTSHLSISPGPIKTAAVKNKRATAGKMSTFERKFLIQLEKLVDPGKALKRISIGESMV